MYRLIGTYRRSEKSPGIHKNLRSDINRNASYPSSINYLHQTSGNQFIQRLFNYGSFLMPSHRQIQRSSLAYRICRGYHIKGPDIINVRSFNIPLVKIRLNSFYNLGPFYCLKTRRKRPCKIYYNSKLLPPKLIRKYLKELKYQVRFAGRLIGLIRGYIRRLKGKRGFEDFAKWLDRVSGLKPSKPGSTPTAKVGAKTIVFIDPSKILSEWSKLGRIIPGKETNPFLRWSDMLHEQHHRKTVLTYPGIKQAYAEIELSRKRLATSKYMTPKYRRPLIDEPLASLPQHIQMAQAVIRHDMNELYKKINLLSAGRLGVVGMDRLLKLQWLPNKIKLVKLIAEYKNLQHLEYEYYLEESLLRNRLKAYYQQWERWNSSARNFATDDLKAYCVSYSADRAAILFIRRCCGI